MGGAPTDLLGPHWQLLGTTWRHRTTRDVAVVFQVAGERGDIRGVGDAVIGKMRGEPEPGIRLSGTTDDNAPNDKTWTVADVAELERDWERVRQGWVAVDGAARAEVAPPTSATDYPPPWKWEDDGGTGWDDEDTERPSLGLLAAPDANGNQEILIDEDGLRLGIMRPYVRALTEAAPEMEAVLRQVEFVPEGGGESRMCPVCRGGGLGPGKHASRTDESRGILRLVVTCQLGALLARIDAAKGTP